jgi:hypothetical protein
VFRRFHGITRCSLGAKRFQADTAPRNKIQLANPGCQIACIPPKLTECNERGESAEPPLDIQDDCETRKPAQQPTHRICMVVLTAKLDVLKPFPECKAWAHATGKS